MVINHTGRFNGGSFIAGLFGEALCQLDVRPEVRIVDVPVGKIRADYHEKPYGWMGWGYRRQDVYEPYLNT